MKELLIASSNLGKIREIKELFQNFNLQIISLSDYPQLSEIEEDGETFEENALKKARTGARVTGRLTLADDSGLIVDYLDGRPGIYSARFAGPAATDQQNNQKLLQELKEVPREKRSAYFKCVIALVDPENKEEYTVESKKKGFILAKPRGNNGFGYDPLFFVPGFNQTMAELPLEIKNSISHRAKALKKIKKVVKDRYKELI